MADKNTGVGRERIGSRGDDTMIGRESTADRAGEYATPDVSGRSAAKTSSPASVTSREESPNVRTRNIRAEIEQTREEMSETVNEIQDRLRPGTIAANAAESVRDTASETMRDIAESDSVHYVRANPIPTAMVGIGLAGLAWLAFGGNDKEDYRAGRYSGGARNWRGVKGRHDAPDRYRSSAAYGGSESAGYDYESPATGATGELSSRAGEVARDLRTGAEQTSRRLRQRAYRAQSRLQRTWNESPLLIGAAAAVLGALIGSALPETQRENELMGETRDNMIEGVEQAVKGKVEQVQNAATDAVNQVQKATGLTPDDNT